MNTVRFGIIGLGNIGLHHAASLANGEVAGASLTAVSDTRVDHARRWAAERGSATQVFEQADALMDAGVCDAVIVATPPFLHPPLAIRAFSRGLHVLIEKPAGAYAKHVREMNAAAARSGRIFGIQFPNRHGLVYRKAKELIAGGELGALQRTQWTSTQWFRTQDYYDSGGWRGTWKGEGGGVLINQCPHHLDLWQWLCGMPVRVRAFCRFGQWHDVEVEDEVTAYVEYPGGGSGLFVCSTGEYPGVNRLEVVGDHGLLTVTEDRHLEFRRTRESVRRYLREYKGGFGHPECGPAEVVLSSPPACNNDNVADFVRAILHGDPLAAPGADGLNSLELSNAMQLSTWLDRTVDIPADEDRYLAILEERIRTSHIRKADTIRNFDVTASWR